jgi:hypothetical protein
VNLELEKSPNLIGKLVYQDSRDPKVSKTFKFGILLCKKGQDTEEEMFCNTKVLLSRVSFSDSQQQGSKAYNAFLNLLGDTITLKNHQGFSGGLDTASAFILQNIWTHF